MLELMQGAGNKLNLVILDACRDNPFSWSRGAGTRGLSVVGMQPPGSIVVYATSAGSVAQDGQGRNGLFTQELLKHLETPGLDLNALLDRTAQGVQQASGNKQNPAVYKQYFGTAYLGTPPGAAAPAAPAPVVSAPVPAAPTVRIARSYGSVTVSAATAGELYLDGTKLADLPAGAEASLDSIEAGEHNLELRYGGGQVERQSATVEKGRSSAVVFTWKKPAAAAPPAGTAPGPGAAPPGAAPAGFVLVPAGSFVMGSPEAEAWRYDIEGPQHEVRLSAFYMSKYEVTFVEYDEYCAATGLVKPGDGGWGRGRRPVINVSWNDAVEYCNWRSKEEGLRPCYTISGASVSCDWSANGYRLPTEAEWEYAAKGGPAAKGLGVNAVYAGSASLDQVAWYSGNSGNQTHPVGEKVANTLGLHDMAGNVLEWCWDWYGSYSGAAQADPRGGASGGRRVLRGGGWFRDMRDLRSASRGSLVPEDRYDDCGFRLARRP